MLTVTNAALGHLGQALSDSDRVEDRDCFRMIVTEEQTIGLSIQNPQSGDQTFEHKGTTVLALPEALSATLSERVLDVSDEGQLVFLPKPS